MHQHCKITQDVLMLTAKGVANASGKLNMFKAKKVKNDGASKKKKAEQISKAEAEKLILKILKDLQSLVKTPTDKTLVSKMGIKALFKIITAIYEGRLKKN